MLDLSDLRGLAAARSCPPWRSKARGLEALWAAVGEHRAYAEASGVVEQRRQRRLEDELVDIITTRLEARARQLCAGETYERLEADVLGRRLDPWSAADVMVGELGA